MSKAMECPACKEIELRAEPETTDKFIVEWYCDACGHYECHTNPDYGKEKKHEHVTTEVTG